MSMAVQSLSVVFSNTQTGFEKQGPAPDSKNI
jgi:hypothetical protein